MLVNMLLLYLGLNIDTFRLTRLLHLVLIFVTFRLVVAFRGEAGETIFTSCATFYFLKLCHFLATLMLLEQYSNTGKWVQLDIVCPIRISNCRSRGGSSLQI